MLDANPLTTDVDIPFCIPYRIGFVAGGFDVIHPGYIAMFREARYFCEALIVAVHKNPSLEHPEKIPPILSVEDRIRILESIKYVNVVVTYETEKDLIKLLVDIKPDIRFLGDDYKDDKKPITGVELDIPIHFIQRSEWSSTRFKQLIYETMKEIN